jgi:hypothetical protein
MVFPNQFFLKPAHIMNEYCMGMGEPTTPYTTKLQNFIFQANNINEVFVVNNLSLHFIQIKYF